MTSFTRRELRKQEKSKQRKAAASRTLSTGAVVAVLATMFSVAPAQAASIPDSFTVNGAGWGHGVGMSQYGAYGMAQEGYNAKQILEHYYNPAKASSTKSYASSDIQVQLLRTHSTTITPSNGTLRVKAGSSTYTSIKPVSFKMSGSKVSFTINGKTYTASSVYVEWEGTRYWAGSGKPVTVSVPKANGGSGTGVYRHGRIKISPLSGQLNIVNSVRLNDEYLYGLAEVPSTWPGAALQAQAIAARTYAMRNMGSLKSACGCNVYDEVQSQKFTGWQKENEGNGSIGKMWKAAVDATQKKSSGKPVSATVITYNGSLIDAVYSSSTGGKTRSGQSVWGTATPYLQSRDDKWAMKSSVGNPNTSWSYSVSQSQASSYFGLKNIVSISIKKNSDGTIASAVGKDSSRKTKTLTGYQFLTKFPNKASWITSVKAGSSSGFDKVIGTAKTTTDVNFRAGMGTNTAQIGVVPYNSTVTVYSNPINGWTPVEYGGKRGYLYSIYLTKTVPVVSNVSTPTGPSIKSEGDVVAIDSAGRLWNYGKGGNGKTKVNIGSSGWQVMKDIHVIDWNKDGVQDIVAQRKTGRLDFYAGKKNGGFTRSTIGSSGWNKYEVIVGNFKSKDKYPNIVAKHESTGKLYVYANPSGKGHGPRTQIGTGWKNLGINMIDWDRDGKMDIVAKSKAGSGQLKLYRTNGAGKFVSESRKTIGASGWDAMVSLDSVNGLGGKGTTGFIAKHSSGKLYYYQTVKNKFEPRKLIGSSGWKTYRIAG